MSKAATALILTWVLIGLLVAGGIGFYLGRTTAPKAQPGQLPGVQSPEGFRNSQQPTGVQQPLQNGFKQPQGVNKEGPVPSGIKQSDQPALPPK